MSDKAVTLGATIKKQNEILSELLEILHRQRDALTAGRHADLQANMSELRQASVRCQAIEAKRVRAVDELVAEYGCEPTVSGVLDALPEDAPGRAEVADESRALAQLVKRLRSEMTLIARLMEEARTLNDMMISEWQKLSLKFIGSGAMGTFDAKI